MNDHTKLKDLMTVKEVAAFLEVTPGRVRQLLADKQLTGLKLNGSWMLARKVVVAFAKKDRPPGNPTFRQCQS